MSFIATCALFAVLCLASRADAHAVGISKGDYAVRGPDVAYTVAFARSELAVAFPRLDADRDGALSAAEIDADRPLFEALVLDGFVVHTEGERCGPSLGAVVATERDGVVLSGVFRCAGAVATADVSIELPILEQLTQGHRHIAQITRGGASADDVLFAGHARLTLAGGPAADRAASSGSSSTAARRTTGSAAFFVMGVEHILTGYDHLLFVLALVLVVRNVRSLFSVVTAFTIAHSITLALATLRLVSPPPGLVEPAIALSIAYVGLENVMVKTIAHRWRLTFAFGLIHGFGFAAALQGVALRGVALASALVSFNLGVEAGQLAAMAIVLPVVVWARRSGRLAEHLTPSVSAAIAVAGVYWFLVRVTHHA